MVTWSSEAMSKSQRQKSLEMQALTLAVVEGKTYLPGDKLVCEIGFDFGFIMLNTVTQIEITLIGETNIFAYLSKN